jgi:hypothetical protein
MFGASAPEVNELFTSIEVFNAPLAALNAVPRPHIPSKVLIIRPLERVSWMTEVTCSGREEPPDRISPEAGRGKL